MSDDLKAPKRIWAAKSASGKCYVGFDTPSLDYANEYVRSDLFNKAMEALRECQAEIDEYVWHEYPLDHPVHERYRKRDLSANPARIALAELEGK